MWWNYSNFYIYIWEKIKYDNFLNIYFYKSQN